MRDNHPWGVEVPDSAGRDATAVDSVELVHGDPAVAAVRGHGEGFAPESAGDGAAYGHRPGGGDGVVTDHACVGEGFLATMCGCMPAAPGGRCRMQAEACGGTPPAAAGVAAKSTGEARGGTQRTSVSRTG